MATASGAHTTIEIFDDRLEIGNPGGLPKGLSSDTFGKKAVRRNPIITNLLQRCNLVENMGTGINKIRQLCFESNIPEPEFDFNDFFTIVFKRKTLDGELNGELNKGQDTVFLFIKKNEGVNANDISNKLDMPFSTVDKHIRVLLRKKLIERRGSKKTGGYFLKSLQ